MNKSRRINRRAFLGGLGAAGISLPWLESLACRPGSFPKRHDSGFGLQSLSTKSVDGFPKRLVVFYTANGTHPSRWFPKSSGSDLVLSPFLQPLERHRHRLVVLGGVDMPSAEMGEGDPHQRGIAAMLTGRPSIDADGPIGGGPSVDQSIANAVGGDTRFRSVELGVQSRYNGDTIYERISYRGPNQPVAPEDHPQRVFERLFSNATGAPNAIDSVLAERRSILDFVRDEYARLIPQVSRSDRERLNIHLESIRDVERRLVPKAQSQCLTPELEPFLDATEPRNFPLVGRLQMDLLATALACDLTRVGSLMWSQGRSKQVFSWLGISEEHHELSHEQSHDSGSTPNLDAVQKIERINTFYAEQLAYFLDRLESVSEGNGTLLDNTLVLWCSDLGEGREHTHTNIPFLLAGGAGGAFQTARFIKYDGIPHNALLVSLHHAMGVDASSFGTSELTGPLPGLLSS